MTETFTITTEPNEHAFRNLKILLAEDNEVNQLLAKGILRLWGIDAKVATTGYEVLDLINSEDFDLILMDIQMPEKSGIEAAGEIRELADLKKKNIPIIALTANGLMGEEKKYQDVGMDDFLTKPFKQADLYEVIERVVMKKEGSFGRINTNQTAVNQMETILQEEKLYDLKQLEEIAAGNQDFLISLARIYLNTVPQNSAELVEASKANEWDKVSKLAHKLKSTVDTMNLDCIKIDIRTLEVDAKNKVNKDALKTLALKVDNVIQTVARQLQHDFSL